MKGTNNAMIIIDQVAMKNVRVRHKYVPIIQTLNKKRSLYITNKPRLEFYRLPNGELLLRRGIDTSNTFKGLKPEEKIPVYISQ